MDKVLSTQQILERSKDKMEQLNRQTIERTSSMQNYFGVCYLDKEAVKETLTTNNISYLFPGDHKGYVFSKDFSVIKGINSSYFSDLVTIDTDKNIIFDGVTFVQGKNTGDYLVLIKQGSKVVFNNCVFVRFSKSKTTLIGNVTTTTAKFVDRKSTRLNSSHVSESRMPSSA